MYIHLIVIKLLSRVSFFLHHTIGIIIVFVTFSFSLIISFCRKCIIERGEKENKRNTYNDHAPLRSKIPFLSSFVWFCAGVYNRLIKHTHTRGWRPGDVQYTPEIFKNTFLLVGGGLPDQVQLS